MIVCWETSPPPEGDGVGDEADGIRGCQWWYDHGVIIVLSLRVPAYGRGEYDLREREDVVIRRVAGTNAVYTTLEAEGNDAPRNMLKKPLEASVFDPSRIYVDIVRLHLFGQKQTEGVIGVVYCLVSDGQYLLVVLVKGDGGGASDFEAMLTGEVFIKSMDVDRPASVVFEEPPPMSKHHRVIDRS
jgi:hypothetical protein